ncbi:MAG: hypothetical protein IIA83_07455 [Thaumarchaeota archaeon]|nr:hypothetical protein [Nitrososphaerota archaeon]
MSSELLLATRTQELEEIGNVLDINTTKPNWKNTVLQFCLDFHDCLQNWTDNNSTSSNEIRKCNNKMRLISRKKGVSGMLQMLYMINKIAEDFETTRKS